jgi:hypothetical protein
VTEFNTTFRKEERFLSEEKSKTFAGAKDKHLSQKPANK